MESVGVIFIKILAAISWWDTSVLPCCEITEIIRITTHKYHTHVRKCPLLRYSISGKSAVLEKRAKFKDERRRDSSFESSEGIYCWFSAQNVYCCVTHRIVYIAESLTLWYILLTHSWKRLYCLNDSLVRWYKLLRLKIHFRNSDGLYIFLTDSSHCVSCWREENRLIHSYVSQTWKQFLINLRVWPYQFRTDERGLGERKDW